MLHNRAWHNQHNDSCIILWPPTQTGINCKRLSHLQAEHDLAEELVFQCSDCLGAVDRVVALKSLKEVRVGSFPIFLPSCMDDACERVKRSHTNKKHFRSQTHLQIIKLRSETCLTAYQEPPGALEDSKWHWRWSWLRWGQPWLWECCWERGRFYSPAAEPPPAELYHPSSSAPVATVYLKRKNRDNNLKVSSTSKVLQCSVVTILEFLTSIRYLEKYRYSIPFSIPRRKKLPQY